MAAFALFLIIAAGLLCWGWLRNQPASRRGEALAKLGIGLLVLVLAVMAITGRLHIVGLLLAASYPFLRRFLPTLLQRAKSGAGSGNRSTVNSDILEMSLDHDSGAMYGRVRQGPLEGRSLESLEEHEFLELLKYCRQQDADSARLLETYLDKRFGESWRADDARTGDDQTQDQPAGAGGEMTREEALEILGLEPDASRDEITQAHRRLMQHLHPDRGGSAYLAARINAARKLLLG